LNLLTFNIPALNKVNEKKKKGRRGEKERNALKKSREYLR